MFLGDAKKQIISDYPTRIADTNERYKLKKLMDDVAI
jgi:hypothetical protein